MHRMFCPTTAALLGATILHASCTLPSIHRAQQQELVGDAAVAPDSSEDDGADAGYDPMWDPKNRNEDFETFQSLIPPAHRFVEWPISDTFDEAKVKPSFSATDRIVTDNVTKLRWQRVLPDIYPGCKARYNFVGRDRAVGSGCTWEEAQKYCSDPELAAALGGGEWRVPTKVELESILDLSRANTVNPLLDTFPIDKVWTSSPYPNPNGLKLAWVLDFMEGYSGPSGRYTGGRVRCVSSENKNGGRLPDYSKFDEDVITDHTTGLEWQGKTDSGTRTWSEAIEYCKTLDVAGGGWRLPLLKELLSIVDSTRFMSATFQAAFGGTQSASYWTVTEAINNRDEVYSVDFTYGSSNHGSPKAEQYVRCVR